MSGRSVLIGSVKPCTALPKMLLRRGFFRRAPNLVLDKHGISCTLNNLKNFRKILVRYSTSVPHRIVQILDLGDFQRVRYKNVVKNIK